MTKNLRKRINLANEERCKFFTLGIFNIYFLLAWLSSLDWYHTSPRQTLSYNNGNWYDFVSAIMDLL